MMLRTSLIAAALTFGFMAPTEASACEATCAGGSCTGTGSCKCSNGEPVCTDKQTELETDSGFGRVAGSAEQFERAVASQLGGSRSVAVLLQAVRAGESALLRSDAAAFQAAHAQAVSALRALSPEEQQIINTLVSSM